MKKSILPFLALCLSVLALLVSVLAYVRTADSGISDRIDALEAENAALRTQLDALFAVHPASDSSDPYCNLIIDSWTSSGSTLTLTAGYASAQIGDGLDITHAELVLYYGGERFDAASVDLSREEAGMYHCEIASLSISLPEMKPDESIELHLEITLSNGEFLSASGASWFYTGRELFDVVG